MLTADFDAQTKTAVTYFFIFQPACSCFRKMKMAPGKTQRKKIKKGGSVGGNAQ